jgi:hypothetical protein
VLLLGLRQIDGLARDEGQLAICNCRADGAGDGGEHERESVHENGKQFETDVMKRHGFADDNWKRIRINSARTEKELTNGLLAKSRERFGGNPAFVEHEQRRKQELRRKVGSGGGRSV